MSKKKNWTGERLETDIFTETSIEHLHRYAIALDLVHNKKTLDIACGEGYGSALLAGDAAEVTGVDINEEIIRNAKEKYPRENLQFLAGSAENIPVADKQFDVVVSFETLEHVFEHEKMISETKRVLRPDGLLIISTPNKKTYSDNTDYKNPFHLKELYPEEFVELLQRHFKNVIMMRQQIAHSSVITTDDPGTLKLYSGDYTEIKTGSTGDPLYCIALASDSPLPPVKNSLFNGQSIFAGAVAEKGKLATRTITYKVGQVILYPFKLLTNLFKK